MKCPLCGQKMRKDSNGLHRCTHCFIYGNREQLRLMEWNINLIDDILATIKAEYEKWENFRVFSLRNPEIAREILIGRIRSKQLEPKHSNSSSSFKQKLLFLIGSVEIGAFLDWFVTNSQNFGTLQPTAVVIPLFMFFQGLVFIFASWK